MQELGHNKHKLWQNPSPIMEKAITAVLTILQSRIENRIYYKYHSIINQIFFEFNYPDKHAKIITYDGQIAHIQILYRKLKFQVYENLNIYITDKNEVYYNIADKFYKI